MNELDFYIDNVAKELRTQKKFSVYLDEVQFKRLLSFRSLKLHKMLPLTTKDPRGFGFRIKEKLNSWRRLIFSDKNSRNLFLFLLLNLSFAFVELLYGVWSNSLGELSHVASVIGFLSRLFQVLFRTRFTCSSTVRVCWRV